MGVFGGAFGSGYAVFRGASRLLRAVLVGYDPNGVPGELAGSLGSLTIGVVAIGYLLRYSEGTGLADVFNVRRPSLREVGIVIGGVVLDYAVVILIVAGFLLLDVPVASGIDESKTRGALLLAAVMSLLLVAPSEELLSRRILQDTLVDEFGTLPGIVLASVLFALPHLAVTYTGPGALPAIAVVFGSGLVYGALYEYTGNLAVPIFVHGTFNAVNNLLNYGGL